MEASIHDYPPEARYTRLGTGGSIGFHLLLMASVLLVAYLNHIRNLSDLLGGVVADTMPPNQIEIILPPDNDVPPPTDHPEFIIQHIIALTPPPPKPKPKPKTTPMIAPHTAVRQQTHQIALGSGGFPPPRYPPDAMHQGIEGTVVLKVEFDGSGNVAFVGVSSSSGSNILDDGAREFVEEHWHNAAWANQTGAVPIRFEMPHH